MDFILFAQQHEFTFKIHEMLVLGMYVASGLLGAGLACAGTRDADDQTRGLLVSAGFIMGLILMKLVMVIVCLLLLVCLINRFSSHIGDSVLNVMNEYDRIRSGGTQHRGLPRYTQNDREEKIRRRGRELGLSDDVVEEELHGHRERYVN